MKVARGPKSRLDVAEIRITKGKYIDGQEFEKIDLWKQTPDPHELLHLPWTGVTQFLDAI